MSPGTTGIRSPRRLGVAACARGLAAGQFSALELVDDCLAAIALENAGLGAWVYVDSGTARESARRSDLRRAAGTSLGPLDGVPVGIKANVAIEDWPCTAGLRFRLDERASTDAFVVQRLRAAGAVLLGSTNMDEGALGAEGANPWYGTTQNPRRPGWSSGGSSSGSGAAVAADHCGFALGTDTIGSIRIPASFCGVIGMKPSHGLISTGGVVPVHLRFDHVGPLVKSAEDLALVLPILAGYDPGSRVSFPLELRPPRPADTHRTIGFGVGFDGLSVKEEVVNAYNRGLAALRGLGAQLVPVDMRRWDLARLRRAILALCEREMWREHGERITARPEDFSDGLRAFIRYGGRLADKDLAAAEQRIAQFQSEWSVQMAPLDAVVLPTVPCPAFPHGERHPHNTAELTAVATGAALPAVSLPLPVPAGELPIGLQLIGHRGGELDLAALAVELEAALGGRRQ